VIPLFQTGTVQQWTVLAWLLWYLAFACLAAGVCAWALGKARRRHASPVVDGLSDGHVSVVCAFLGLLWPLLVAYGVVNGAHRLWRRLAA
jgi:hypothetical protein